MGNSSTKESGQGRIRREEHREDDASDSSDRTAAIIAERLLYGGGRSMRGTRANESILSGLGLGDGEPNSAEHRKETKEERQARKTERERQIRERDREKSIREEHVDGGYLVTLGTYIGPEDFSKSIVRQLHIQRRLAPFWRGLNDHDDSWAEHQLVAAVRGQTIPAPDEITSAMARSDDDSPVAIDSQLAVAKSTFLPSRAMSIQAEPRNDSVSSQLSTSLPVRTGGVTLLRGRARTLAAAAAGEDSNRIAPLQEIKLAPEPNINGQPIEAYLYKDATECPICFLYYPPYLNRSRCCDQPICSECFVQIKRSDPHVPEHHDDPNNTEPAPSTGEEGLLISEPSQCPFCVAPEFGVTYEPPPFRRGLIYADGNKPNASAQSSPVMSSPASFGSTRRRAVSLSATDKSVITTDMVRPDWSKKLADARANALRKSLAATALHNAAYLNGGESHGIDLRQLALGRRRRVFATDSPSGSPESQPGFPAALRRARMEDLEDMMMMEAIRQSIAAEEERKQKEGAKEEKRRLKDAAKEAKKADKLARKSGRSGSLRPESPSQSSSSWASVSTSRTASIAGPSVVQNDQTNLPSKGKAPAAAAALCLSPLDEPISTLNRDGPKSAKSQDLVSPISANTDGSSRVVEHTFTGLNIAGLESAPHHDQVVNEQNDSGIGKSPISPESSISKAKSNDQKHNDQIQVFSMEREHYGATQ